MRAILNRYSMVKIIMYLDVSAILCDHVKRYPKYLRWYNALIVIIIKVAEELNRM